MTNDGATSQGRTIPVTDLDDQPASNVPAGEAPPSLVELALSDEELKGLCVERICPACTDKTVADDAKLRMLAEMDNYKKRLQREKDDFVKFANESLVADLIPALDAMDLALMHGSKVDACKDVVLGVEMTRKMFLDILAQHGLCPVGAVGEEFSPERHEALGEEPRDDMPPGLVCQLVSRGYIL
ncbi:MAG: nucleotide exchange factor GrpE, partial [Desulfovibrio sp.]|nr:nucleotide exchange factor GrpE [Desulfovibrio sp.]